jgi:diguanylate cyclase (GGDEF)-like protein
MQVVALGHPVALAPLWSMFRPDLVVLSAHAPAFTSVAVARRLQAQSRGSVPFLYLLDAPDPDLRMHVLERGHGVETLSKPLDLRELVVQVRALLRFGDGVRRASRPEGETEQLRDRSTRTWSRLALLAFLQQESLRCARQGGGFGVLGVHLDGLRRLRRACGRPAGERLVRYAAAVLLQGARDADVVARVAADRFAVLLPSTPAEDLPRVRTRTAERFERARFQLNGRLLRLPVKLGMVAFPDVHGSPRRLLALAFQGARGTERMEPLLLS